LSRSEYGQLQTEANTTQHRARFADFVISIAPRSRNGAPRSRSDIALNLFEWTQFAGTGDWP
jgi:hypothetical protein